MAVRIISFFLAAVTALLSVFGISFKHDESKVINVFYSNKQLSGENEKTREIDSLLSAVKQRTPVLTPCEAKKPFPDDNRITAVFFNGEKQNGKDCRVFAYIGFPQNASADDPVPAMVLVHGGAGHAYADWVRYWVNNGYAAISVDGFGQIPADGAYPGDGINDNWSVDPKSHSTIDELRSASEPFENQWFYHYICDAVLGGNILRADPRVITDKIGITGISWGSIAASVVMCFDNRFSFAVPVYGSGFLNESTGMIGSACSSEDYIKAWEPSNLLGRVTMPVLYLNGDADPFFSPNCTTASAANTENGSLVFIHGLAHGQNPGAYPPEILRFANEQNGLGPGGIKIEKISFNGKNAVLSLSIPEDVSNVKIRAYYRSSTVFDYNGFDLTEDWKSRGGIVLGSEANVKIPEKAECFYISVTGKAGKTVLHASTGLYSVNDLKSEGL